MDVRTTTVRETVFTHEPDLSGDVYISWRHGQQVLSCRVPGPDLVEFLAIHIKTETLAVLSDLGGIDFIHVLRETMEKRRLMGDEIETALADLAEATAAMIVSKARVAPSRQIPVSEVKDMLEALKNPHQMIRLHKETLRKDAKREETT